MNWETALRIFEILIGSGLIAILFKANRVINRVWDMLRDYPPHRHVGEDIVYPPDYSPGRTEKLGSRSARA